MAIDGHIKWQDGTIGENKRLSAVVSVKPRQAAYVPPQHLRHPARQPPPANLDAPETPTKRRLSHRAACAALAGPPWRARLTARLLPCYSVT
jgi:hypothetical protein